MEREGKGFTLEGNTNPRYMTEFEILCKKMDEHNSDEKNAKDSLSEDQLQAKKDEKERELYGRQWIWEGYF